MLFKIFLLLTGVFACSTSVIFIRESELGPVALSAVRLLLAALILIPLYLKEHKKHKQYSFRQGIRFSIFPAFILAIHFISWNMGARLTPAANASLIVNLVPLAMPFFLFLIAHEKINRLELIATGVAVAGLAILASDDFNLAHEYLLGDIVCFISMLLFALYLVLGKKNKHFSSIWSYLVPMYFLAGVICLMIALLFEDITFTPSAYQISMLLGLTLVPTIIGHSILNYSMQVLRGQVVSIVNISQFISAGILGYIVYHEVPSNAFYFASSLLVVAVTLMILWNQQKRTF